MPDLIKVMISSRCSDKIKLYGEEQEYSILRREIKKAIIFQKLFKEQFFDVWINEDSNASPGDHDTTEVCLQKVDWADLLIVLFNGNAGWISAEPNIGICHDEFRRAWDTDRSKILVIKLPGAKENASKSAQNKTFYDFVESLNRFRGGDVKDGDEAIKKVLETLHETIINIFRRGKSEALGGRSDLGQALDWSLKDYSSRQKAIQSVIKDSLDFSSIPIPDFSECGVYLKRNGSIKDETPKDHMVLALIHAIPDSMSVAAAREMVGRPFYRDYDYCDYLSGKNKVKAIGPIHFIGCYKNVTETQVRNLVGLPDIVLIASDFGVYMHDKVHHTQLVFLAGCRDKPDTQDTVAKFLDWLKDSGETSMIITSAYSRKEIITAIKKEYTP